MKLAQHALVALFCLAAFSQTLLYAVYLRGDPATHFSAGMFGDRLVYLELSHDILRGEWQGRGHFMPGYPAALALAQVVFGSASAGIVLLQALVYAGLVLAAYHVAAAAFGSHAAPWAAGFLALQPSIGYYAGQEMTEFLTAALVFGVAVFLWRWSRRGQWIDLGLAAALCTGAVYMRSEWLGFVLLVGLVVLFVGRAQGDGARGALAAVVLVLAVASLVGLWAVRAGVETGRFVLYNESPTSNLILMGTWYRIFDPDTWAQLQEIEKSDLRNEAAIARAGAVGPRPELSQRYMSQVRGPYQRPLGETLSLALGNVAMYPTEYLVNHFVKAPILIWAARNPVRHSDFDSIPTYARWGFWSLQLAVFLLALWQAGRALGDKRARMLGAVLLACVGFLTAIHVIIAVDERFTAPALPLIQVFAGAALAGLLARKAQPFQPAVAGYS